MPLKLAQSDELVRSGWWKWSIWVEGTDEELDQVKEVTYLLHPSFPDPVCVVSDRSSAFRISTAGWGEFTIHAEARLRDGSVQKLRHQLELHMPKKAAPPPDTPHIFLSYSAIDGRLAAQVSRELESHGVKVINSGSAAPGSPDDTIRAALENSHAIVALQSDTYSNAVRAELSKAHDLNKPVVHVQVGAAPSDEEAPRGNVLQFAASAHADAIAKKVMQVLEPMAERGGPRKHAAARSTSTRKGPDAGVESSARTGAPRTASTRKSSDARLEPSARTGAARTASTRKAATKRSASSPSSRRGR
ncbi:MAG TPA: pYEATS domain-containing protein [Kofleriaceae bacterium]